MELSQHGFLEELMALRRDTWNPLHGGLSEFFPGGWSFDAFDETHVLDLDGAPDPTSFAGLSAPIDLSTFDSSSFTDVYPSLVEGLSTGPEMDSNSPLANQSPPQEHYPPSAIKDEETSSVFEDVNINGRFAEEKQSASFPVFNMGASGERKNRPRKLEGQPSKNLMAERRRRKRLNDRLSMLRSIVPKISKMDRTSILGDTIDYMKELLERINKLQEGTEVGMDQMNTTGLIRDPKPNEGLIRNSPKFDVERRDFDTRIEICCAMKPGLLLSTVNTLEALGLEIQQCVISGFNDFSMQASCSEEAEQQRVMSPEDIKQALFRTAGYGGRCLQ